MPSRTAAERYWATLNGPGSNTETSRTLLLWDGIPLNSPFGGWIYWTRVDPETVDRIEISRGASTSVFGDKAMGAPSKCSRVRPSRGG